MWTIQRRSSALCVQWRDGSETRVLRPDRRPSGGDPDGPGQDNSRHLPPSHAPESEGVQRYRLQTLHRIIKAKCSIILQVSYSEPRLGMTDTWARGTSRTWRTRRTCQSRSTSTATTSSSRRWPTAARPAPCGSCPSSGDLPISFMVGSLSGNILVSV